ncbi:unnamed protein product, partial [Amoebophrya sp. A25]
NADWDGWDKAENIITKYLKGGGSSSRSKKEMKQDNDKLQEQERFLQNQHSAIALVAGGGKGAKVKDESGRFEDGSKQPIASSGAVVGASSSTAFSALAGPRLFSNGNEAQLGAAAGGVPQHRTTPQAQAQATVKKIDMTKLRQMCAAKKEADKLEEERRLREKQAREEKTRSRNFFEKDGRVAVAKSGEGREDAKPKEDA